MVETSLKIPAIDMGTEPARLMMLNPNSPISKANDSVPKSAHKYSLATIANANAPGKMMTPVVMTALLPAKCSLRKTEIHPSIPILTMANVTAMSGASQNIVANGLLNPIDLLCITSSVRAHLRPANPDAEKTMMMPGSETEVVLKTMRKTPNEIREMTEISRREYFSRWKRKAKMRTKMSVEDLHMARDVQI